MKSETVWSLIYYLETLPPKLPLDTLFHLLDSELPDFFEEQEDFIDQCDGDERDEELQAFLYWFKWHDMDDEDEEVETKRVVQLTDDWDFLAEYINADIASKITWVPVDVIISGCYYFRTP